MRQGSSEALTVRTKTLTRTSVESAASDEKGDERSLSVPSEATTATLAGTRDGCLVCQSTSCQLITHRLLTLDLLRRLARSNKESDASKSTRRRNEEVLSRAATRTQASIPSLALHRPATPSGTIDQFMPFPIKGVNRDTVQLFHEFFTNQGSSLLESRRELSFDSGVLPPLFTRSFENPALATSFVAMAATFHAIQAQGLTAPNHEVLIYHAQAFEELRKNIEAERPGQISEGTIMAAINLCMCCGIGFGDSDAALLHWQGVLALLGKPRSGIYSGAILSFIGQLEHWLVLTAGYKPRVEKWTVPIPQDRPPPRKYGKSLKSLCASSVLQDFSLSPKILEMCSNICRATETLEAYATRHAFNKNTPVSTYFIYLRNVIAEQGSFIHNKFRNTSTFAECISLGTSLFYILALRRTPWKAPFRILCAELRRALSKSKPLEDGDDDDDDGENDDDEDEEINRALKEDFLVRKAAYNWMLFTCACAASACQDKPAIEWTKENLEEVQLAYFEQHGPEWKPALIQDLKKFVWSDVFLAGHLQTVCTDWEEQRLSRVVSGPD